MSGNSIRRLEKTTYLIIPQGVKMKIKKMKNESMSKKKIIQLIDDKQSIIADIIIDTFGIKITTENNINAEVKQVDIGDEYED